MGIKFTNNAEGTLTAGVGSSDTTNMILTAGDGLLFPTIVLGAGDYFYATLVDASGNREIVSVTEHQAGTDVFQTFVREQDDTTGIAFAIGDKVQLRLPKIILEEYRDDIATNASDLVDYETSNDIDIAALEAYNTASAVLAAPSGLTMYMYNPTGEIPTGWSAKSGPADCLLAIAGGAQAYNVAGENLAGSWTPTTHTHTGPSHVHTGPSHTHTIAHTHTGGGHVLSAAEMPAHAHTQHYYARYNATGLGSDGSFNGYGIHLAITSTPTDQTGSGSSHSHGTGSAASNANSGSDGTGNTGASGTAASGTGSAPSTDRPYAAVGLLIERD
jgi:hypothetical protein